MIIMDTIIAFFDHPFFSIVGGVATIAMIGGFLYTAYLVVKGIIPVWYRLGIGLSKRKIAVFASGDEFASLKDMLVDSKLFKEKNVIQIPKDDLDRADKATVFLVHWMPYEEAIDKILSLKKDSALIVYAPQNKEKIPQDTMDEINSKPNTVVVNFRGRLLNDIVISLITTSYDRNG